MNDASDPKVEGEAATTDQGYPEVQAPVEESLVEVPGVEVVRASKLAMTWKVVAGRDQVVGLKKVGEASLLYA